MTRPVPVWTQTQLVAVESSSHCDLMYSRLLRAAAQHQSPVPSLMDANGRCLISRATPINKGPPRSAVCDFSESPLFSTPDHRTSGLNPSTSDPTQRASGLGRPSPLGPCRILARKHPSEGPTSLDPLESDVRSILPRTRDDGDFLPPPESQGPLGGSTCPRCPVKSPSRHAMNCCSCSGLVKMSAS